MKIIPAIDILNGKVVRLFRGEYTAKKEFSNDPCSTARFWQDQGAEYLHVVDLDGAKAGEPKNFEVIEKIIKNSSVPIEVGGGIRTVEHIERYFESGVDKLVLGSAVMHNVSFLDQERLRAHCSRIVISVDAIRDEDDILPTMKAGTHGWKEEVPIIDVRGLIDRLVSVGIQRLNYTDRSKDGTLAGLSDKNIVSLSSFLGTIVSDTLGVVYAGGIASVDDLRKLAAIRNRKLDGVIIGMALYENKFTLREAKEAVDVG